MRRKIQFEERASYDSLGRNGRFYTHGVSLHSYGEDHPRAVRGFVVLTPITSRGDSGRCEIAIDIDSSGELGVSFLEAFCRGASQGARDDLLRRVQSICAGEPDPVRAAEEAEAAPAIRR
jgi:hypothetical protein